jgi:hypothetical protein
MQDPTCYCNGPAHKLGKYEFVVPAKVYYSGGIVLCPECGSSHITKIVHGGFYTLEDAKVELKKVLVGE